ncbi:MAG: radical SAM protein [Thermoplasmata archaeon]
MEFSFGPVPSRRLGLSLGINNVIPKTCSYSCVYCQLGKTINLISDRRKFYDPEDVASSVRKRVNLLKSKGIEIDYLTFVPDGEPTLDINLENEIKMLKDIGIKIAVITNSSLIHDEDVRNSLYLTDFVSLKIDSVINDIWKRVNVPHRNLILDEILSGIVKFSKNYHGNLATETMLIRDFNDSHFEETARFIGEINPDISYISVPTRPPAYDFVKIPDEKRVIEAYEIFKKFVDNVQTLTDFEGENFVTLENTLNDIMNIISVHPMREDVLLKILNDNGLGLNDLEILLKKNLIKRENYNGKIFYIRKFKGFT